MTIRSAESVDKLSKNDECDRLRVVIFAYRV